MDSGALDQDEEHTPPDEFASDGEDVPPPPPTRQRPIHLTATSRALFRALSFLADVGCGPDMRMGVPSLRQKLADMGARPGMALRWAEYVPEEWFVSILRFSMYAFMRCNVVPEARRDLRGYISTAVDWLQDHWKESGTFLGGAKSAYREAEPQIGVPSETNTLPSMPTDMATLKVYTMLVSVARLEETHDDNTKERDWRAWHLQHTPGGGWPAVVMSDDGSAPIANTPGDEGNFSDESPVSEVK